MKKMYSTNAPKSRADKMKMTIKIDQTKIRNELHFLNCQNSNVAYVAKDKSKIIPRKQKYKKIDY